MLYFGSPSLSGFLDLFMTVCAHFTIWWSGGAGEQCFSAYACSVHVWPSNHVFLAQEYVSAFAEASQFLNFFGIES